MLERYVQKQTRLHKTDTGDGEDSSHRTLKYQLKNEGFSSAAIQLFLNSV